MIDFDEIETEEVKSEVLQRIDEERRKREEEERQKQEEAARFKFDLSLEQEIERRCQVTDAEREEEGDGVVGVRLVSSSGAVLIEGLNDSLVTIGRQFAKHHSEHPSFEFLQRGVAAIVSFLNALLQCRFHEGVAFHLEQLQLLLSRPKTGLCALLLLAISSPPEVKEAKQWEKLSPCLHQVLACLRRMQCWVTTRRQAAREALSNMQELLAAFFSSLAGPVPAPTWPAMEGSDVVEVALRFSSWGWEATAKMRALQTVEELKRLLVECWQMHPAIRLFGWVRSKAEPLQPAAKIRSIRGPITIMDADGKASDCRVQGDPKTESGAAGESPDEHEEEEEEKDRKDGRLKDYVVENAMVVARIIGSPFLPMDHTTVAGAGWVLRWHILRTTPITAARLLHELRTQFQAVEFQEMYKELKMRMRHIDCALKVQQQVLPAYGFADTISGVCDMRGEVMAHEFQHGDRAIEKLRKEIHGLLEYGEPPRKMPVTRAITPPRIPVQQTQAWLLHLANEGYAVIANVASQSEVEQAYGLLWDFIEASDASGRISRKQVQTWFDATGHDRGWPGERDDGIIHTRGIGQSQALWYLRSLPALRGVFASIWGTDDLVSSFDGAGVFRPYGQFENWRTTKKNWFHVDQTHKRRGLHCVQGLLNMKSASRETGGLVVVPRSHRLYADVLRRYDEPLGQDSLHLDVTDPVLTEGDTGPRLVCAEAGDLIVWDSRTVHCNTPPLVDDATLLNGSDLIRAVAYICMTPASWCAKEVADRRQMAQQNGITTTHVPHAYRPMDIPERFLAFQLTLEQKQLVAGLGAVGDGRQREDAALQPGRASFLPEVRLQVSGGSAPVRGAATLEWGSTTGTLAAGAVVAGYRFGEWLRMSSWSEGSFSSQGQGSGEHEELWVPMKWPQGHLQLLGHAWVAPLA